MKGKVDFTRLGQEFLNPDTLLVEGVMDADLSTTFTVNDLAESRFGKVHSSGKLSIDKLKAFSQPLGMDIFISGAHLAIDTTHQKSLYIESQNLMRMTMGIDSLNFKYKDEISTNISKLEMLAQTSPGYRHDSRHTDNRTIGFRPSENPHGRFRLDRGRTLRTEGRHQTVGIRQTGPDCCRRHFDRHAKYTAYLYGQDSP